MNASDWPHRLADPEAITRLFDSPPPLSDLDLFNVHIDERGTSVTLGFELPGLPDHPPAEWLAEGLNTCEFFLTFHHVTALRLGGWHGTTPRTVDLTSSPPPGPPLKVTVTAPGDRLSFAAATARVSKVRAYLAART